MNANLLKPCIIVFVGTVGAGKSTQISQLLSTLNNGGVKATATVLKRGHFLTHMLEVFLAKLLSKKGQNAAYEIEVIVQNRPVLLKKLFKLFLILDLVSIFYRFIFTVYLPKKLGYVVVVEEYIQAAIADYDAIAKVVGANPSVLFTRLLTGLSFLGGRTYTIFLDASDETLKARWVFRKSPVQRLEYLGMQRTQLFALSRRLSSSFVYINTEKKTVRRTGEIIASFLKVPNLNGQLKK